MNHGAQIKLIKKQIKAKGFMDEDDLKALRYHQLSNQEQAKSKIKLIFIDFVYDITPKFLKNLVKRKG
ncbi:hypothetical protein BE1S18E01_26880 [Acinetobacter sp. BEC1-S18-ESBL-01]|uniref:hypothetical protein n=1 Tax=Acinetobacter TaxID=469 RepID=UPI00070BE0BF|nr:MULTISPECIES: hypothetical protein [Acinetobacter]QNB03107.1 hypothetical protein H2Q98_17955 [Acinetobacter baumannii]KRJ75218.1 hypothetical protein APC93_09840 [Acinetobacter pittii]MBJ9449637.1 hypothetical protein [Acinetobacter pittii]MCU4468906.1 hypothetical protein [Acinetobacter pittii]MCY3237326.1 hypothetical protein [Acinetobacter pittii]